MNKKTLNKLITAIMLNTFADEDCTCPNTVSDYCRKISWCDFNVETETCTGDPRECWERWAKTTRTDLEQQMDSLTTALNTARIELSAAQKAHDEAAAKYRELDRELDSVRRDLRDAEND